MPLLPTMRFLFLLGILVGIGISSSLASADYSIGTIIETTGPVHDSFSGTWQSTDGNGSNISGVYSDSVMTNGGSLSLTKQVTMTEDDTAKSGFDTQKVIGYSSGNTGAHLIADEYLLTSSESYSNTSGNKVCFGNPYTYTAPSCTSREQSGSFSIINAQNLTLSSAAKIVDGSLDYSIQVGTPGNTSSGIGLKGTLITKFEGKSATDSGEIQLYDRTLISGLIDTFSRMYHGGENLELSGISSSTGKVYDKTIMEQKFSKNDSGTTEINVGSTVYIQDIMTNGGRTNETRQISGSGSISSERIISFQSDGDRSIQASEHAVATRINGADENSTAPTCVFSGQQASSESISPYKEASAQTGIAGVSSASISSTTFISDPDQSDELTLEYRADISIPVGFDASVVKEMKDSNNDGLYEDLNGNGHLDMHDLVLLFNNFRWIGESNISSRIDYNKNNRADYADIVTIFNAMNKTSL